MAAYVIVLLVALAAGVLFVLYRRGVLPEVGASKEPRGRLHERAQGGEQHDRRPRTDEFVDSQAAVWDTGTPESAEPPALFVDDVVDDPFVEDEEAAYEEVAYEEPAYEEPAYEEPAEPAYEEAAYEEAAESDDEEPADRFASRAAAPSRARQEPPPAVDPEPHPAPLLTSDGTSTLARRTPKAESEAKRQPARLAQAKQRPSGVTRRSPDQVRSMLTSYRGGLKKARDDDEPQ
jgi:hypothetical protein